MIELAMWIGKIALSLVIITGGIVTIVICGVVISAVIVGWADNIHKSWRIFNDKNKKV